MEQRPLLGAASSQATGPLHAEPAATPASASVSIKRNLPAELSSFPCLSLSTTTLVYDAFLVVWERLQRALPWARPVFVYCEEHELIGATTVGAAVALYVLIGYFVLLPSLQAGWVKTIMASLFTLEVVVGYACLWLFRNTDPGYLPVNEGALDPATADLLSQPQYQGTHLIPTRDFHPVYTPRELAREARLRAAREAAGDFSDLNNEMLGLSNSPIGGPALREEWCRQCRGWKPPRAAHCYVCMQCVVRFDHHCGLLGNCVGQRNHRFFLAFVALVGVGALTLLLGDLVWVGQLLLQGAWATWSFGVALLLLPVLAGGVAFGFIAYFHCRMLLWDVTMKERYGRKRTPQAQAMNYSEGHDGVDHARMPRAELSLPEAVREIWENIGKAPWALKRGSVALREKQATRRAVQGNYGPVSAETSSRPATMAAGETLVDIASVAGEGGGVEEEQVGCTGVSTAPTSAQVQPLISVASNASKHE